MNIIFYTSNCTGNEKNCLYPNYTMVSSEDEFRNAVALDHTCTEFKNSYRGNENFIAGYCIMKDNDNESEKPEDWIYMKDYLSLIPEEINYAVCASRHNMLSKNGKSPRPRQHVYFPTSKMKTQAEVRRLQKDIQELLPFFDTNAQDPARFFYGSSSDEVIWHEGSINIDDYIALMRSNNCIQEGSRNTTMSRFAGRVLKRFGNTEKSLELFEEEAAKCEPPLGDEELHTIWCSALKFYEKIKKQPGYVPPEQYSKQNPLKPDDYSDIGEAKVFIQEYGEELCYTEATDYLRYNGRYWEESEELALAAAVEFMDMQLSDALARYTKAKKELEECGLNEKEVKSIRFRPDDDDQRKAAAVFIAEKEYFDFVMKRRNVRCIKPMLEIAKTMVLHDINEFDSNPFLLNTPDGTYDLREGMSGCRPHNPKDYITKITAVSPTLNGLEIWNNAVDTSFCSNGELIEYAQEQAGLSIIGKVFNESLQMAHGEGCNGKSTYYNVQAKVCGSYAGVISSESLIVNCRRNIKPEMAELKGKRLVIAAELEEGQRLSTSALKQMCSTDKIEAEKKYEKPFSFEPTHTLVLYTNHLPKVSANDRGTWRRIIVIPFTANISGRNDIKNYADYLYENAGGAVLAWMIEGAKRIIAKNYVSSMPEVVKEAISSYRENNDWWNAFVDECCETGDDIIGKSGEIYQEYRCYCQRNGDFIRNKADFYAEMENQGFKKKKTSQGIMVKGLSVKFDFLD